MREIKDDLDEIKDLLRDGKVVHAEHALRIQSLERAEAAITAGLAAVAAIERSITDIERRIVRVERAGGWNWRGNILRLGIGLLEKGILIVFAMAWWAMMNGYGRTP
jgi:hypothetical protein